MEMVREHLSGFNFFGINISKQIGSPVKDKNHSWFEKRNTSKSILFEKLFETMKA